MRLVLIDDHEVFRMGLRALLTETPEIEIVGEAGSGEEGLNLVARENPDMVVLDYAMPGESGLETLDRIKRHFPHVRVVMLTASKSESVVSEAIESGANGVVLKQDASTELISILKTAYATEHSLSTSISPLMARQDALGKLTKREKQVLRLIAQGYRNREIGEKLNVSLKTIDSHRTNLMRKLDIHNLVDLVALANETGISDSSI